MKKIILGLVLFANIGLCYAADLQCPSANSIRHASFTYGFKWGDEWMLYSEPLIVDGNAWSVVVDTREVTSNDKNEAIEHVQSRLVSVNLYEKAIVKHSKDSTECSYSSGYSGFDVAAENPYIDTHIKKLN